MRVNTYAIKAHKWNMSSRIFIFKWENEKEWAFEALEEFYKNEPDYIFEDIEYMWEVIR